MLVDVIQFLKPNGRQRSGQMDISDKYKQHYEEMTEAGCRFELEVLTTGQVSTTVSDSRQDIDIRISPNGPEVREAMESMLNTRLWNTVE